MVGPVERLLREFKEEISIDAEKELSEEVCIDFAISNKRCCDIPYRLTLVSLGIPDDELPYFLEKIKEKEIVHSQEYPIDRAE